MLLLEDESIAARHQEARSDSSVLLKTASRSDSSRCIHRQRSGPPRELLESQNHVAHQGEEDLLGIEARGNPT